METVDNDQPKKKHKHKKGTGRNSFIGRRTARVDGGLGFRLDGPAPTHRRYKSGKIGPVNG